MALRNIITLPNDTLSKKSREITAFDDKLWVLLDDMYDTLMSEGGVGIAAVQVGILRRVIVVDITDEDDEDAPSEIIELINPEVIYTKGNQCELEGCLSFAGKWGYVERPTSVRVKYVNRYGKPQIHEADGLLAIVLCHEIDHLDGIMFNDIAVEMLDREPTEEEFEERNRRIGIGNPKKRKKKMLRAKKRR